MKHRYLKSNWMVCLLTASIAGGCLFASCEDWTDPEEVNYAIKDPSEQNPELWARYTESLRVYKLERPHYITYASFNNGVEPSKKRRGVSPFAARFTGLCHVGKLGEYHRYRP